MPPASAPPLPSAGPAASLSLPATLRLGLFQGCLGCLAVIFSGLLNRVMLSELGFPGLLVGFALACEQFVAPARVLFGQISDSRPIGRRHRVPYVLLGTALFCALAVLSVPLIFRVGALLREGAQLSLVLAVAALCGLFALYGLAISLASTPYLALVIDRTQEAERPRAVGIIWCLLTVGIVIGAVLIGTSLRALDGVTDPAQLEAGLTAFMLRVALAVCAITVFATWGMESPREEGARRIQGAREDGVSLAEAWSLIRSSPQVLIFFIFLVLFTLGLFLQDPILESYGAQVFAMPIAATAQLNAFWGVGTLLGLLVGGLVVVPRLGKLQSARLGCRLITASLVALLLCGLTASVPLLRLVMLLFGLAAGLATNSALCLMLDLTLPEVAGTFVGVWGLAQALSRALGKVFGGGLLDLGRLIPWSATGSVADAYPSFALVLVVECLISVAALLALERLNVRQFREDAAQRLDQVFLADTL